MSDVQQRGHTLTIVIPALDEEEAIGDTIDRCLDARAHILQTSAVEEVEIIVVSDGSTDRTEEIARSYEEVTVLAFERNRGYGAAIMCGFEQGRGDLVGFLDADGTCDPRVFANLCRALDEEGADVALGSRMGPGSEMPRLRAAGNLMFAWILGLLSWRQVKDTASGMRVIRRACLPDLYPLPEGLHFTPAMSARVLLEDKLKLVEIAMPYAERVGRSKLSVLHDGVRFLTVIVQAAVTYRPARPLLIGACVLALLGLASGIGPLALYVRSGHLEEWMIYRILLTSLFATLASLLMCAAVVADRIAATAHYRPFDARGVTGLVARAFTRRARLIGGTVLLAGAVLVAWPGIVQYQSTGQVDMHWSRAVAATLLVALAAVLAVTTFLLNMMDLMHVQRTRNAGIKPPDRVRRARKSAMVRSLAEIER